MRAAAAAGGSSALSARARRKQMTPEGGWMAEPPPYPPIQRGGAKTSNLSQFIDMCSPEEPVPGLVMRLSGLARMFNVTFQTGGDPSGT